MTHMKKRTHYFPILALLFILPYTLHTQNNITGLWEMTKVEVGDQIMTPVAKWTRINEDGSYQAGNGWLQNAAGQWSYDAKTKAFEAVDPNGIKDEFGPFTVSFKGKKMMWERMEEGMKVIVTLSPIQKLPKATGDQIVGLWDLTNATKDGSSILEEIDPDDKQYLFIRWDRIYVERNAEGQRKTGYWHIHGHKPELTLLSHDKAKDAESWRVEVSGTVLVLKGLSDSNTGIKYFFNRINEFPR